MNNPADKSSIYTLGAARSGTVYLNCLINELYKDSNFTTISLGHSYEAARDHIESGSTSPIIVAIRNPYDSLASDLIGAMMPTLTTFTPNRPIEDLTWLWETVSSSDLFLTVPFDIFTVDPYLVVSKISKKYPELAGMERSGITNDYIKSLIDQLDDRLFSDDSDKLSARAHVPRAGRPDKSEALAILKDTKYNPRFNYLASMYDKMIKNYEEI